MMTDWAKECTTKAVTYSIPMDLMTEILLKLPAKSVMRFRCVSKSWHSIIHSKQFIEAFMSRSLSRPRLVFIFNKYYEDPLLSLSSSNIAKENTLTMPKLKSHVHYMCNSVRGFLCCRLEDGFVVCNPTTGQVIDLGELNSDYYYCYSMYLGYDPNSNQYKVLRLTPCLRQSVRTLGGKLSSNSWRPIETNVRYSYCYEGGVCIDGVVYYKCKNIQNRRRIILNSFDVGSEKVHDIDTPQNLDLLPGDLTNYLGKLAVHCCLYNGFILWVLDDAKKQVWSQKTYVFPSFFTDSVLLSFRFEGITAAGEIIYVPWRFLDQSEILCYDVEKKMERRVRFEERSPYICRSLLCSYIDNIIYL